MFFRFHSTAPYVTPKSADGVAAQVQLRRSVAVLGFRNLPGRPEDDWLSPVFSEMLDTELGTHGDLRMVSSEDVARIKHQLPPVQGGTLARTTLEQLRRNPGADVVVLGSYTPLPGKDEQRIRLDLRVQDTADGETIAEEAITGDRNNLFALAAQAGARLRMRLGLSPNSSQDASAARLALPADQHSARLYVEGREKLWAFDFLGARDLLLQAVAADPQFPLAHSALSEAWWHLGYADKARAEAEQARRLIPGSDSRGPFIDRGAILAVSTQLAKGGAGLSRSLSSRPGQPGLRLAAGHRTNECAANGIFADTCRASSFARAAGRRRAHRYDRGFGMDWAGFDQGARSCAAGDHQGPRPGTSGIGVPDLRLPVSAECEHRLLYATGVG